MKKRILSLIIVSSVIIGILVTAYAVNGGDELDVSTSTSAADRNFYDVINSDWFFDDVKYVSENGLMNGTSASTFEPNGTTTRSMIVTVLWRLEGMPDVAGSTFEDVEEGQYYSNAIGWAAANSIVAGYGDGTFGPLDYITREQMAAVLYRYAAYKGYDISARTNLSGFEDVNEISEYAVEYMEWANAEGLITGTSHETLSPKGNALRSQVAAILKRFCENIAYDESANDSANAENTENYKEPENSENLKGDENKENSYGSHGYIGTSFAIIVEDATAVPGDKEVVVPVLIENNPGVLGMILSVSYDETVMSMTSATNGEAVSEVLTLTQGNSLNTGCIFVWDGLEISPSEIKDGTILLMKFNIANNAPGGNYQIVIVCDEGDIVDNELYAVSPTIKNGYITIKK